MLPLSNSEAKTTFEVIDMNHGVLMACRYPPSWEPQEEGMMSTAASLPSV
jgi:hypothetical protein